MPLMGTAEICDFSPWTGWSINATGSEAALHRIETPIGLATIYESEGMLTLRQGEVILLRTTLRGRLDDIVWERNCLAITIPPCGDKEAEIWFPSLPACAVAQVTIDGGQAVFSTAGSGISLALPAGSGGRRLRVFKQK